jgi:hypothetical protein
MIEEKPGRRVKSGESFGAPQIVRSFHTIEEMHQESVPYKGHTRLTANASGWRLL